MYIFLEWGRPFTSVAQNSEVNNKFHLDINYHRQKNLQLLSQTEHL